MYELIFSNGLSINDANDDIYSIEIVSKLDNSKLNFGTVSSVSLSLKLNNRDKRFSNYTFKNQSIICYINSVKKYTFYTDEIIIKNGFINIIAYDKIADLDRKFKGTEYPVTLNELIVKTLGQVGLSLDTSIFRNQGFIIHNADLSGLTCREVLGYCLEIAGGIGILNSDEKFVIKWFSVQNTKEIDINNFISYESDEEDIEFNNVRFSRGNMTYDSNSDVSSIKGTIYITSDNPLLEHSTSGKIKSLIENLNVKHLSYFPCKVQLSSIEKYSLGDCLSFTDENEKEKIMLVSNIVIKNLSNVTVESLGIDTSVSESDETGEDTGAGSTSSVNFNIKGIVNKKDVQFADCNSNTKIFVSCTITFTGSGGNIDFKFDNKIIRTYTPVIGTNTFTFTIEKPENPENLLTFETNRNHTYQEYSFIYCNCIIVDYNEEDDPEYDYEGIEEIEGYELYNIANIKLLKSVSANTGLGLKYTQNTYSNAISNFEIIKYNRVSNEILCDTEKQLIGDTIYNINTYTINANIIRIYDDYKNLFDKWLNVAFNINLQKEETDYDYKVYARKILTDGSKTDFTDITTYNSIGMSHEQVLELYVYVPKNKNPYVNILTNQSDILKYELYLTNNLDNAYKDEQGYYRYNSQNNTLNIKPNSNNPVNGLLYVTYQNSIKEFDDFNNSIKNNIDLTDEQKLMVLNAKYPRLSTLINSVDS